MGSGAGSGAYNQEGCPEHGEKKVGEMLGKDSYGEETSAIWLVE